MARRFANPVSDDQEASLRATAVPTNTKTSTEWGIRVWEEWARNRPSDASSHRVPPSTPLLQMPVADLSYWMGKFVLEVRKKDEEALLWSSGQFGTHNAKVILNTVYYYNCKVFGLRSFDEHRNLQCSQYKKEVDEQGRVYLEYTDFGSKTNRGGLKHVKVENNPHAILNTAH